VPTVIAVAAVFAFLMVIIGCKNSPKSPKIHLSFAAMMFSIGLLLTELWAIEIGWRSLSVSWFWLSGTATISVPAWFYLYFSASLCLQHGFQKKDMLHFVPTFIYLLLSVPYVLLSYEDKSHMLMQIRTQQELSWIYQLVPTRDVRMGLVAILIAFYLPLCWHELHSEMTRKKQDVLRELSPYRWVILVFAGMFAFSFFIFMVKLPYEYNWLIALIIVPVIIAFGVLYWRLPQWGHHWWQGQSEPQVDAQTDMVSDKKYRSSVDEAMASTMLDKTQQLLAAGLYKDSTLTLRKLANKVGISGHHLSQIINEHTSGNYYDLINGYRLEEAKRLLQQESLSIIDVAYESGFNSKSAFYSEFKKQTGQTPGQYRDLTHNLG